MRPAVLVAILETTGLVAWEAWPEVGEHFDCRHAAVLVTELGGALVAGDPPRAAGLIEGIRGGTRS